jgi:predicted 3-demethylubiquinone-9 3-methyltransferase (glyoxalase superfamily)
MPAISPCLWFDDQAEEAATFYTGVFKNARITGKSHYGEALGGGPSWSPGRAAAPPHS